MRSFQAAFKLACDWIECDCRASADGIIVLAHDPHVIDSSGARFEIAAHTAARLASLDLGSDEGVPSLDELVSWANGRVGIMADVKVDGWEREIGEALSPLRPESRIVPGAGPDGRRRFREMFPDLAISTTVDRSYESTFDELIAALDSDAVTPEYPMLTEERTARLHERGIKVYPWTVDDIESMHALIAMGADGIISNRADLLAKL